MDETVLDHGRQSIRTNDPVDLRASFLLYFGMEDHIEQEGRYRASRRID